MSPPFVLHNTFGAAFIGLILASTLYGISIVQAWYYYTHQNDDWVLKSLVAAVMASDTVHQILISHCVYAYTVTNWGDPSVLQKLIWSLLVEVLFNGITAFLVQSFMTMRVWRLSNGNIWLTGPVILLVVAQFLCVVAYTILSLRMDTFAELAGLQDLSMAVNVLAAVGDVLIAGALCTMLHLSRTGFHRLDTIITKLMLFVVNTGLVTSLCAVASLISTLVAGHTFFYITFFFCIGRLYSNSLLATLNARKMIRNNFHKDSIWDKAKLSISQLLKNTSMPGKTRAANISINITTTEETGSTNDQDNDQDMDKTDTSISSNARVLEDRSRVLSFSDA